MWGALGRQVPWKGTEGLGCERAWVFKDCLLTLTVGLSLKPKLLSEYDRINAQHAYLKLCHGLPYPRHFLRQRTLLALPPLLRTQCSDTRTV